MLYRVCLLMGRLREWPTFCFFFFNDTATTEIYTLSLHDALPISVRADFGFAQQLHSGFNDGVFARGHVRIDQHRRSEEHTSELQSQSNLVCRLLLEKKKNKPHSTYTVS